MLGMNSEQWLGLIRQIMPFMGGIFVSLGWIKPATLQTWTDTLMQISGPALIVISAVWSAIAKTQANIMASAAAQIPPNSTLAITTNINASAQDKDAAHDLARAAGDKVVAKVTI